MSRENQLDLTSFFRERRSLRGWVKQVLKESQSKDYGNDLDRHGKVFRERLVR